MARDSSFLVYFDNPSITLADAGARLAPYRPEPMDDALAIPVPPGDTAIFVGLMDEDYDSEVAEDLARRLRCPGVATCQRRFECFVEDLEVALAEHGVLAAVQEQLWRLTNGYVFLSWTGAVVREPE